MPPNEPPSWDQLLTPGQTAAYGARRATPSAAHRANTPAMLHAVSGAVKTNYAPGDQLGQYKLVSMLGQGGMGTVFLAEHMLLERQVAIKILLPEFANQLGVVHRFFKEAQAVNRIGHPNLIDIMDVVEGVDHLPYLVMEVLEGESLSNVIQKRAPMNPTEAVSIGRQMCGALAAVHAEGIVHRDLKPDNVFITETDDGRLQVKLLDFGIAKFMAADDSMLRTLTGEPIGTPEYMAPEQIEGLGMDHRLDIYAMGVILYEMLTGRPVFQEAQVGTLLFHHLNTVPVSPSELRRSQGADPLPEALDDAILSCLAKDPAERVQSMSQLDELLDWSLEEDTGVVVLPDLEAVQEKTRAKRNKWLVPAGISAAAAVLLALSAWWLWPGSDEKSAAATASASAVPRGVKERPAPPPRRPAADTLKVTISSYPSGANIYRVSDGVYVGKTPHTVELARTDRWHLKLFAAQHHAAELTITGTGSSAAHAVLTRKAALKPEPKAEDDEPKTRRRARQRSRDPRRRESRERARPTPRRRGGDVSTVNPFE